MSVSRRIFCDTQECGFDRASQLSSIRYSEGGTHTNVDAKTGKFVRAASTFRRFISKEPGAEFPPEKGRYHLYVSSACPWGKQQKCDGNPSAFQGQATLIDCWGDVAQRVLIVRKLKGLEDILPFTCVHWHLELNVDNNNSGSWRFATAEETVPKQNMRPDPIHPTYTHLSQLYLAQEPDYSGRYTVPLLYDTKTDQIVSNESSEILRMLYTEFDKLLPAKYAEVDLFPANLRKDIEETNDWTYHEINNGVYKSGASIKQEAYEEAVKALFAALDRAEAHLASSTGPFYYGSHITESDVRLYVTVVRFDPVYHQHFKCNIRDIRSGYPALHQWLRWLYWSEDAFNSTTDFQQIKNHYTKSHLRLNPAGITALGPLPHILGLEEEVAAVKAKMV